MEFRILGSLEVHRDGRRVELGAPKPRALLALLLIKHGEPVPTDVVVEQLWDGEPPATAPKIVHVYVSQLRKVLDDGVLQTVAGGYELSVGPDALDAARFEHRLARGHGLLGEGDARASAAVLREALDLWRGPALADFRYAPFAHEEIARLEELRVVASELRLEAELQLGRHREAIPELERLVHERPYRENLRRLLMLALYRADRQADALAAYRDARATLSDELGLEPSPSLQRLQASILRQDPTLEPAPGPQELPAALDGGSPLLAGRGRELAELVALLADACKAAGGVAFVSGPAGIGKTRLAAELAREALRRRMTVCSIAATPGDAAADLRGAEDQAGSTLLVVDDAEDLPADVLERAARLAGDSLGRSRLVVVLHRRPRPPPAFAGVTGCRIELGRLGTEAVLRIAGLYLPMVDGPLAEALASESAGVPLAVHRTAAAWARTRASDVIAASAGRAATERAELRAAEEHLSSDLLAFRTVDERGRRYGADGAPPSPAVCPFQGLTTYDEEHAEYFFGRERLVAALVSRLVGSPLLTVVGPTGSGKSSAVRAGLLPALAAGVLPGSERWTRVVMRPGEHPLAELERTYRYASGDRVVLVVDQFEETFTACRDEDERGSFLDALVGIARDDDRRGSLVLAMRADFYDRCAGHEELARLVSANQVLVGPMRRDELTRAIELPARRAGLQVEPALTDALIADVLDQPGGLPLLSVALLEQWGEREGRTLRHTAYERTGGVSGAVARLAERTYAQLDEPERAAARRILLRLADADAGDLAGRFVRRRVPHDELDSQPPTAAALDALVASRLVTSAEDTLEVAHEALLHEWPRLRGWLEEDAEGRRLHQHLSHTARDWHAAGRHPGELYRAGRLASLLDWTAGREDELNDLERDFLEASHREAEREADRQRRVNRRLRALLAGIAALLVLALAAGAVALGQRGEARQSALTADAQRLGAQSLTQERLDRALLLARTGVALDETPATRGNLLSVLLRAPAALGVLEHDRRGLSAAVSPDGRLMAFGDDAGTVSFYDTAGRRLQGAPHTISGGAIQQLRFSPDGEVLAITSSDPDDGQQRAIVELVDPRTHRLRLRLAGATRGGDRGADLPAFPDRAPFVMANVVFLGSTGDLVVALIHGDAPNGPASVLYRVEGGTGAIERELRVGRRGAVGPSVTADGRRLLLTSAGDHKTWEIDTGTLRVRRTFPVGDLTGVVSPDGRVFVMGSGSGRVRSLDLRSGRVRAFRDRHDGAVVRAAFAPGGDALLTSDADGQVIEWDVGSGTVAQRFTGHSGEVGGLDVSADGRTLVTAATDGRAIVWDIAGDRRLDRRFSVGAPFEMPSPDTPRGSALSPDGRTLAVTHSTGTVDLVDTGTLRRRATVQAIRGHATVVAFSPDGRLLAIGGESGRIVLLDTRTLRGAGELTGLGHDVESLAFSPDGRLLVASEVHVRPTPVRMWDVRRRTRTRFRPVTTASSLAFSPDGRLIAMAAGGAGTEMLEARSGRLVKALQTADSSRSVAFSPDGDLLVVGLYNGMVAVYSTRDWKQISRPIEAHTERVTHAGFTPDGRVLATAGADGSAALWDVATQKPIGAPVAVAPGSFTSAAFTPDGSHLFAVSTRGDAVRLDATPEAWKRHACLVAGRDLTPDEWHDVLPERPYRTVCSRG